VPSGLDEVTMKVLLSPPSPDFDAVLPAIKRALGPSVARRKDGKGISVPCRLPAKFSSHHAHVTVELDDSPFATWEISVVSGPHHVANATDASLPKFSTVIDAFRDALGLGDVISSAMLSVSFSRSLKEWRPTVPFPLGAPPVLSTAGGAPRVCGLDLEFTPTGEQPYVRAFVTTYSALEEVVARVMMRVPSVAASTLLETMFSVSERAGALLMEPNQP
jgi:hypothetical protein